MPMTSPTSVYLKASYLARVNGSVDDACDLYEHSLSATRSDATDEAACQAYADFLLTLPVPPFARLVHHVKRSIKLYPSNTMILSLLVHLRRQGRDILEIISSLPEDDTTINNGLWATWAIAAIGGQSFWQNGSAERERVRVLLERIVSAEK